MMASDEPGQSTFQHPIPSYPQTHLRQLIEAQDYAALSAFLSTAFPQLPADVQTSYTALPALQSPASGPAALLLAATRADSPAIFKLLWDTLYARHTAQPAPTESPALPAASSTTPQIPYPCLQHAARTGSLALAQALVSREPSALSRAPPPAVRGGRGGSQILTALRAGNLAYVDFMLGCGVGLDHEWPRVRVARTVAGLEQSDEQLEERLRWLVERGVRLRGAGALRVVARCGTVEAARVLLDAGADVEDLEDDGEGREEVEAAAMEAVRAGNAEMVKLLVQRGADVNRRNSKGESPLGLAEAEGRDNILAVLKDLKS